MEIGPLYKFAGLYDADSSGLHAGGVRDSGAYFAEGATLADKVCVSVTRATGRLLLLARRRVVPTGQPHQMHRSPDKRPTRTGAADADIHRQTALQPERYRPPRACSRGGTGGLNIGVFTIPPNWVAARRPHLAGMGRYYRTARPVSANRIAFFRRRLRRGENYRYRRTAT